MLLEVHALIVDDDALAGLTLTHFVEKAEPGATCTRVTDGVAALRELAKGAYDIVFLDLELPELDGRRVLEALKPGLPVIVVTAHTDFAARAYDFDVVDYLVKPPEYARFCRAWEKFLGRRSKTQKPKERTIVVRDGARLVQIALDQLLYLESESNYTRLVCRGRSLLTLASLKQMGETLPTEFMRVHRSFIVNTRLIHHIEGSTMRIGEHNIPIGETYRDEVLKRFAPVN
jgi:two-component system LytT family response regulator